jgi:hypothetical protein
METRKQQNTGAEREGLIPRKKDKEGLNIIRGSNQHCIH